MQNSDIPEHFLTLLSKSLKQTMFKSLCLKKEKAGIKETLLCPFQVRVRVLIPTVNKRTQQNLILTSFKTIKYKLCLSEGVTSGVVNSHQLSPFNWRMRVERTLVQTLASQLSPILSSSFDRAFR